jgi:hypothetical protein
MTAHCENQHIWNVCRFRSWHVPLPRRKKRAISRNKRLALLLIALLILIPLLWFVGYGLLNKPSVNYTFGGADVVRSSYRLTAMTPSSPGTIDIFYVLVQNSGRTDLSVIITVHATNALVSAGYYGPYNNLASILIVVLADTGYRYVPFYITLKSQISSFTMSCDGVRVLDYSTLPSSMASTFGEIHPLSPTMLTYSQESTNSYNYQLAGRS